MTFTNIVCKDKILAVNFYWCMCYSCTIPFLYFLICETC